MLSVIIVNYNVRYFLEQALLSVRRASLRVPTEVWVVDNNSVDDSVAMVREKFPEVRLIANVKNTGFAVANNQAIRESTGKYVLLLNPDTVVEEDTFEKCLDFMEAHPDAGGLGVRMIDGSGRYLPESKRGFPSPWVAMCKTIGLSTFFPTSKLFNGYYLGHLSNQETNPVDVLAGAFMLMRRATLDKIGLLDETFFMYGEDIDLSYRIVLGGYKNYYLPTTSIIHYKGESTKKGSLNYVRVFYQAMIIFARKHFSGSSATAFVLMLQCAIYVRAALTVAMNLARSLALPLLDAVAMFGGLVWLKNFWATYYFGNPTYYRPGFMLYNAPFYVAFWVAGIYFSGGYDGRSGVRRLVRGVIISTVLLAAVYGLVPMWLRSSRAIIMLGSVWAVISTVGWRLIGHFVRFRNFRIGDHTVKNIAVVGNRDESKRVVGLLHQAQVPINLVGTVASTAEYDPNDYLSSLENLEEVVRIYKVDELIFCSRDVSAQDIMRWMSHLGDGVAYKIVPEESMSIIGSSSKNAPGELYTIDIRFLIDAPFSRRNKRLLDVVIAVGVLAVSPLLAFVVKQPLGMLRNVFSVLVGNKTWVGYEPTATTSTPLPKINKGVLTPIDEFGAKQWDTPTRQRLNFLYAKDYTPTRDLDIIWNGIRQLGR